MNLTIDCTALQKGLSVVTRALAVRPSQKVLEGVLLQCDHGQLHLICTDSNLTIKATYDADIIETGSVVLPGRFFTELTKKLPNSTVSIASKDDKVNVKCMASNSSLVSLNAFEFPQMPVFQSNISIRLPQKKLRDMILKTSFAISNDENRPVFTGSLLEITNHDISIVALDGFRIAVQICDQINNLPDENRSYKAIIPGKMINELSRILADSDQFCTISFNEKQIRIEFDEVEIVSVLLSGDFVDYRNIIPTQFKTKTRVSKGTLQESVDRASLLAKEGKNNTIRMRLMEDHLRISSRAEMGEVNEEMDVQLDGDPIDIAFNSKYLTDILSNIPEDTIYMNYNSSVSPCVIRNPDNSEYIYMILPMRVS